MPINRVKDSKGRNRYEFEFSRRIGEERIRTRKILPIAWSRTEAEKYDRIRCAEIDGEITGTREKRWLIDDAIAHYNRERAVTAKAGKGTAGELAALAGYWLGKPLTGLSEVCAAITNDLRPTHAPATIRNKLRYLIAACRYGWKHHKMGDRDPGAGIPMPAVSNERHTYIDRADMLLLCKTYCPVPEVRAAIRIAFYSGMRRGEILAAAIGRESFILEDTKNGERREVPIHPKVRCCAHYEWPTKYKLGYWFRKARYVIARPEVRFHDLRHSAASAMINEGVELFTVGAVLGHKSQASTGRYAHLAQRKLREAVGQIGRRA